MSFNITSLSMKTTLTEVVTEGLPRGLSKRNINTLSSKAGFYS